MKSVSHRLSLRLGGQTKVASDPQSRAERVAGSARDIMDVGAPMPVSSPSGKGRIAQALGNPRNRPTLRALQGAILGASVTNAANYFEAMTRGPSDFHHDVNMRNLGVMAEWERDKAPGEDFTSDDIGRLQARVMDNTRDSAYDSRDRMFRGHVKRSLLGMLAGSVAGYGAGTLEKRHLKRKKRAEKT